MSMVKITMEALQLNSSLAAQRKEDRRKKALVGDKTANDCDLILKLNKSNSVVKLRGRLGMGTVAEGEKMKLNGKSALGNKKTK